MLCSIDADMLLADLTFVDNGMRANSTTVTLRVDGTALSSSAGDSDSTITATSRCRPARDGIVDGTVNVHAGPFVKLLGRLEGTVELDAREGDLEVRNGRRSYSLLHADTATTTGSRVHAEGTTNVACDVDAIAAGVAAVRNACDANTPIVSLSVASGQATIAATDTYRLAGVTFPTELPDMALLVPAHGLLLAKKRVCTAFGVDERGRVVHLSGPGVDVTFRTSVTGYPNVGPMLAARPPLLCDVNIDDLRRALGNLSAIADDQAVAFTIDGDRLQLTVRSRYGSGAEDIAIERADSAFTFLALPRYVDDAAATHAACGATNVEMRGTGPAAAISFTSTTRVICSTIVMPVKPASQPNS